MADKKTYNIYGFNETQLAKLIKTAAKDFELAVAKVDGAYYATDSHWIFCIPETCAKVVASIIEATNGEKPDGEYTVGPKKFLAKTVVDKFNEIHNSEGEDASLSPWYYETHDGLCRLFKTESGFYPYNWRHIQVLNFESGYNPKIIKLNDDGTYHALAYSYAGAPRAVVMGIRKTTIVDPPGTGDAS